MTEESSNAIYGGIKPTLESLLLLASASFVFYFMGYVYKLAYFFALGIPSFSTNAGQEGYVIQGVMVFGMLLGYLPILLDWYLSFTEIEKTEKMLAAAKDEAGRLSATPERSSQQSREALNDLRAKLVANEELLKKLKQRFLLRNPFKVIGVVHSTIFVSLVACSLAFSFRNPVAFLSTLLQIFIGGLLSAYLFHQIRRLIITGQPGPRFFQKVYLLIVAFLLIWPIFIGCINGWERLYYEDFPRIDVVTQNGNMVNVELVAHNSEMYLFRTSKKYIAMPIGEIREIDAVAGDVPWVYYWFRSMHHNFRFPWSNK